MEKRIGIPDWEIIFEEENELGKVITMVKDRDNGNIDVIRLWESKDDREHSVYIYENTDRDKSHFEEGKGVLTKEITHGISSEDQEVIIDFVNDYLYKKGRFEEERWLDKIFNKFN